MKQEEKDLLVKDLSARLPYGVKVQITSDGGMMEASYDMTLDCELLNDLIENGDDFKPYLRPMSSMTEEERKEYKHLIAFSGSPDGAANLVNWFNEKMFAYRTIDGKDMFKLGLALEAPDGMYKED